MPGYVDTHGINIQRIGDLPMGCAAACLSNITVQRLAVEAAVHADIMLLRQAMMMDPLVGAVCNPPEIWQMVDEMLIAEADVYKRQGIYRARRRASRRHGHSSSYTSCR